MKTNDFRLLVLPSFVTSSMLCATPKTTPLSVSTPSPPHPHSHAPTFWWFCPTDMPSMCES